MTLVVATTVILCERNWSTIKKKKENGKKKEQTTMTNECERSVKTLIKYWQGNDDCNGEVDMYYVTEKKILMDFFIISENWKNNFGLLFLMRFVSPRFFLIILPFSQERNQLIMTEKQETELSRFVLLCRYNTSRQHVNRDFHIRCL